MSRSFEIQRKPATAFPCAGGSKEQDDAQGQALAAQHGDGGGF